MEDRKPIKIFLHTYGGQTDVTSGLCDAILASRTPVWTINAGWSMSSGALILACGHKRFCMKNSAVLIHSGSSGFSGTMQQVKDVAQFLDRLSVNEDKLLLDHTEIPKKTLSAKSKNEWYLFADDQLKYGLVDKIVESIDEVV